MANRYANDRLQMPLLFDSLEVNRDGGDSTRVTCTP